MSSNSNDNKIQNDNIQETETQDDDIQDDPAIQTSGTKDSLNKDNNNNNSSSDKEPYAEFKILRDLDGKIMVDESLALLTELYINGKLGGGEFRFNLIKKSILDLAPPKLKRRRKNNYSNKASSIVCLFIYIFYLFSFVSYLDYVQFIPKISMLVRRHLYVFTPLYIWCFFLVTRKLNAWLSLLVYFVTITIFTHFDFLLLCNLFI